MDSQLNKEPKNQLVDKTQNEEIRINGSKLKMLLSTFHGSEKLVLLPHYLNLTINAVIAFLDENPQIHTIELRESRIHHLALQRLVDHHSLKKLLISEAYIRSKGKTEVMEMVAKRNAQANHYIPYFLNNYTQILKGATNDFVASPTCAKIIADYARIEPIELLFKGPSKITLGIL